jgi:hypothetical protein
MAIAGGALVYAFLGVDAPEITTDADALWPSMRSPLAPPSWFGG